MIELVVKRNVQTSFVLAFFLDLRTDRNSIERASELEMV